MHRFGEVVGDFVHERKDLLLQAPVDVDSICDVAETVKACLQLGADRIEVLLDLPVEVVLRLVALQHKTGLVLAKRIDPAVPKGMNVDGERQMVLAEDASEDLRFGLAECLRPWVPLSAHSNDAERT